MDSDRLLNFSRLEIILNYKCNLDCVYCYVKAHGEELYPPEYYEDEEKLLLNLRMLLDWIYSQGMNPELELFSGEALIQRVGLNAIDLILEKWEAYGIATHLTIPTNYTFLPSKYLTTRVEGFIQRAEKLGGRIFLSASFDGKYMETNRPFTHKVEMRDDDYYDHAFSFVKKHGFGFHPMLYSKGIERWEKNFLWFQEMLEKHDLDWYGMYLLEIRNKEWSREEITRFGGFIEFLIEYSWNKCDKDIDRFLSFLFKHRGFNILTAALSTVGRGLGCSLQSVLYVRIGDLAIIPCHRTCYEQYVVGRFETDKGRITEIKSHNLEIYLSEISMNAKYLPYCENCVINDICSHGCLGSQLETTGDMFTPIPTVCALEYEKYSAMIRAYKRIGVFETLMNRVGEKTRRAFRALEEINEKEVD